MIVPQARKSVIAGIIHQEPPAVELLDPGRLFFCPSDRALVGWARPTDACGSFDYHVSVRPFDDLDTFHVYPIRLEDRLPPIAIPLLPGDPPVTLDLQAVFDRCYDAGPYAREVRYGIDAVIPPLGPDRTVWAQQTVQAGQG